ncbi:MAG TPA: serine/threonine-protein kinase, partial [Polyangiaceae bacterium]
MLQVGTVVANRFELLKIAASGGIGTVYQAHDRAQGRLVAVKLLKQLHPEHIQRFKREAELLARLDAPGFVRYIDFGVLKGGQPFLATEWLNGEDLDARLARGKLRIEDTITLATKIATSLAIAHQHGVIHRDIKPSNLWLVDRDTSKPKILDLGLARFIDAARSSITSTGAIMGTPSYMSPEQARGGSNLDARTDVFSLGCVLYECLAGTPPFAGDQIMAILAKIVFEDAPRVRNLRADVPRGLERLVQAMLSREPADRPRDAGAVAAALTALHPSEVIRKISSRPPQPVLTHREQRVLCVLTATLQHNEQGDASETDNAGLMPNHEQLRAIAVKRGGRLELLANGCLIATFSSGGQAADLALAAARTALALRPLIPNFCMALATGRAVVGDRVSIGEAVQRTAHLLELASAGDIRVDAASIGLLESRFVVENRLLVSERPTPSGERVLLGRPTTCVGRDWELATLGAAFSECVEESAARVVLVTAAAGMGKTRVRYEFLHRSRTEGAALCVGAGDP